MGVGDVCLDVVLPITEAPPQGEPDVEPGRSLSAYAGFALVVGVFTRYAVVVPIVVREITRRPKQFDDLLRASGEDRQFIRLPELGGAWDSPALALLYKPHTVLSAGLRYSRAASMTEPAARLLAARVARMFAP